MDCIDVNAGDDSGNTALHKAAASGNSESMRLLLDKHGIEVNMRSRYGLTPLMLSARIGNVNCVKILLASDDIEVDAVDNEGNTALLWAAMESESECLGLILNSGKCRTVNRYHKRCISPFNFSIHQIGRFLFYFETINIDG